MPRQIQKIKQTHQEHTRAQTQKNHTNTNPAADLLRFSQTTKPRYTKSQLKLRFSHLSINNETSSKSNS